MLGLELSIYRFIFYHLLIVCVNRYTPAHTNMSPQGIPTGRSLQLLAAVTKHVSMKQLLVMRICGIFASAFMFCSKIIKSTLDLLFSTLGIRLSSALGTSERTKSTIIAEHLETLRGCLWLSGKDQVRAATRLWTKKAPAFSNGHTATLDPGCSI